MDVTAKNQLLECHECHSLYHQECHDPPIYQEELDPSQMWYCSCCKRQTEVIKSVGKVERREKVSTSPTNMFDRGENNVSDSQQPTNQTVLLWLTQTNAQMKKGLEKF